MNTKRSIPDNVFAIRRLGVEIPKTSSQEPNIRIVQIFKLITIPNCFIAIVITSAFTPYN
jgi:hypothetical protein